MECIKENWKDIDRYFRHTYVKVDGYGDTLFFIDHVNPNNISGTTEDNDYFEIELHNHQPFNLSYVLPHKAVFQFNKRAVLLQRVPAKQFKRGLHADNVSLSFTDTGVPIDVTLPALKAFTTKQRYFSFSEAFLSKGNKYLSFALTSRMSCAKASGGIFIDTTKIATFLHESKKIVMEKKAFKPEVERHLALHQDKIEVI